MTARPLRLAHVFATFGAGGPQLRALQLMARLGPGHEHVVVAMDGDTTALSQQPPGVVLQVAGPPPRAGAVRTVLAQRRWLASLRPDLVLTYNWGAIETAAAARWLGLPLVHHEDGFLPDEYGRRLPRRSWLRRLVLRRTPVVVPSAVLRRIATVEWRLDPGRVLHLPNGVDLVRFAPRAAAAGGDRALVVGTVGGLRPEKDHATLLRALARLPAVRACIVGGGPLAGALRQEAAALGVADRVEFRGPVHDSAPCYAGFDLFVLSSRTEQMPLALLEAMACALPVVATDVGDVRALLPVAAAAGVVPPGDDRALAAAIARLAADPQLRRALGAANRATVERDFEAGRCLDRFVQVYRGALAASR